MASIFWQRTWSRHGCRLALNRFILRSLVWLSKCRLQVGDPWHSVGGSVNGWRRALDLSGGSTQIQHEEESGLHGHRR